MIEKTLERIANALESLAGINGNGKVATAAPQETLGPAIGALDVPTPAAKKEKKEKPAPAPAAGTPTPAAETAAPTIQDVTAYLRKFVDKHGEKGTEKGKELLAKYKANRISEIKAEQYPAILKELKAAVGE